MTTETPQGDTPLLPMEEISDCPFCKNHRSAHLQGAHLTNMINSYWVRCHNCGACGPRKEIGPLAITAWNNRANARAADRQEIAALKAQLDDSVWRTQFLEMRDRAVAAEAELATAKAEKDGTVFALMQAKPEMLAGDMVDWLAESVREIQALQAQADGGEWIPADVAETIRLALVQRKIDILSEYETEPDRVRIVEEILARHDRAFEWLFAQATGTQE